MIRYTWTISRWQTSDGAWMWFAKSHSLVDFQGNPVFTQAATQDELLLMIEDIERIWCDELYPNEGASLGMLAPVDYWHQTGTFGPQFSYCYAFRAGVEIAGDEANR